MNSWSLLYDYMNETHDDAPWIDIKYDGFDEEQIKKVLKSQQQTQELLNAAHRVADGGVPLGKLIREGHQDPMNARVRYEYAAILRTIIEQCGYTKDELLVVNIFDILGIIEVLEE